MSAAPRPVGHEATPREVVALLEELSGRSAVLDRRPDQAGDVRRTAADARPAAGDLGREPSIGLCDGLRGELDWLRARRDALARTVRLPRRRREADARVRTAATGGAGIG